MLIGDGSFDNFKQRNKSTKQAR